MKKLQNYFIRFAKLKKTTKRNWTKKLAQNKSDHKLIVDSLSENEIADVIARNEYSFK